MRVRGRFQDGAKVLLKPAGPAGVADNAEDLREVIDVRAVGEPAGNQIGGLGERARRLGRLIVQIAGADPFEKLSRSGLVELLLDPLQNERGQRLLYFWGH